MLFNSLTFLFLFFPLVTVVYFALPHRFRWGWLLGASCYFYMTAIPIYICILGFTIVVDYAAALWIEGSEGRARRVYFGLSVASTVLVLFVFKYFNFANENVAVLAKLLGWNYSIGALKLALPLGLSFHTFQSLAYVVEVYRGEQKAERHFGIYALYVMFYPQLVAGPIERPQNLLHQFREEHRFDAREALYGVRRIAYGLFKKAVIADSLGLYVDAVYGALPRYTALPVALASVAFTVEIYCDFSGYSDIAVGTAQIMGFKLMENFDRPFLGRSLTDYWRRWHRSLSTWFNDYVFIPLHTRVRSWGMFGLVFALMGTFLLSGVWHGAAWTFVAWGALHGAGVAFEAVTKKSRRKLAKVVGPLAYEWLGRVSMLAFVTFTFVFFRARNLDDAGTAIREMVECKVVDKPAGLLAGLDTSALALATVGTVVLGLSYRFQPIARLKKEPGWAQIVALAGILIVAVLHLNRTSRFIYFAF